MCSESLVFMPKQMESFVEYNFSCARQFQLLCASNFCEFWFDCFGLNQVWRFATQTEQNGTIGAVAMPSEGQRTVEFCLNSLDASKFAARFEASRKVRSGAHRPHRMGARRPNAYFED